MSQVDIADIKRQAFAEDYAHDDAILQGFIDTAEEYVRVYLRRDLAVDFPLGWPAPIKQAAAMLATHFYERRSATEQTGKEAVAIPFGVTDLLAPYRNLA